ncbi:MAG: DUF2304 domain-containing protein [Lachnospiraceae bacterium]
MMTFKIQVIIAVFLIIALIVIINMIRRRGLELKYALSWMIAIFFVLVLDCFPVLLAKLSRVLGIWAPVNMIFFLGFCFSLVIIFILTIVVSRMSERIKKLSQTLAIHEELLEKLQNKEEDE